MHVDVAVQPAVGHRSTGRGRRRRGPGTAPSRDGGPGGRSRRRSRRRCGHAGRRDRLAVAAGAAAPDRLVPGAVDEVDHERRHRAVGVDRAEAASRTTGCPRDALVDPSSGSTTTVTGALGMVPAALLAQHADARGDEHLDGRGVGREVAVVLAGDRVREAPVVARRRSGLDDSAAAVAEQRVPGSSSGSRAAGHAPATVAVE